MAVSKKRVIKSLESLNDDLKDLLRTQYPNGYEGSITRIVNAKREPIFVFPLETEDATYLIKIPVTKNSDGEYDVEQAEKGDFAEPPVVPAARGANDDDFGSTNDDFDRSSEEEGSDSDRERDRDSDYDEEGGGSKRNREASYDPDFDG